MVAAQNGHLELVKALVRLGADMERRRLSPYRQPTDCTALMLSAERGHAEIVRYLIDEGADKFSVDDVRALHSLRH